MSIQIWKPFIDINNLTNCKEKGIFDSINSMATDVRRCSVLILVDLSGVRPLAALHASIFGQDVQETPSFPQCLHYTVYQDVNDRKYSHVQKHARVDEVMRPDDDFECRSRKAVQKNQSIYHFL